MFSQLLIYCQQALTFKCEKRPSIFSINAVIYYAPISSSPHNKAMNNSRDKISGMKSARLHILTIGELCGWKNAVDGRALYYIFSLCLSSIYLWRYNPSSKSNE